MMRDEDDHDRLAAEYVLGVLEGHDAARAERMLASDGAFAAAVAHWRARFSELDQTARPLSPGEALWHRIEGGLAEATAAPAPAVPVIVPDPRNAFRAAWRSLAFWRFASLAGAAATVLLTFGLVLTAQFMSQDLAVERARKPVLVAVLVKEGTSEPGAVVNAFASGRVELIPLERINVPPDRALEIWTLWDRGVGPRSVGLIREARSVELNLQNLPRTGPNQLFEITVEPAGGSPTGRPTGPILMKGTTSTAL
jgi:anti-sigma-K factor RskA